MKLPKINFYKFLYPTVIIILTLVIVFFYINSINFYHKSQAAGEKIRVYIKEVALEKVKKENAQEVINLLNNKPRDTKLNLNTIINPFKKFEKEPKEVAE